MSQWWSARLFGPRVRESSLEAQLRDLAQDAPGRYAVVQGDRVVAVFDTLRGAYVAATKGMELGRFEVVQVPRASTREPSDGAPQRWLSRFARRD
jgi:hypothetical protein